MTTLTIVYITGASLTMSGDYAQMDAEFTARCHDAQVAYMLLIDHSGMFSGNCYIGECRG